MNGTKLEVVDNFVYLGITLNKHLSWKPHVDKISNKISKVNGVLNKLKKIVPLKTLTLIYKSLIVCHLNYGILLWGNQTNQIAQLQKKSVRIITRSKYNAHTDPIFRTLKIQKVEDIKTLKQLSFFHKFLHKTLPPYFDDNYIKISQNSSRRLLLHIPRFRHEYFRNNLRYCITSNINKTDQNILRRLSTHSWESTKTLIIEKQIAEYATECTKPTCYVCGRR